MFVFDTDFVFTGAKEGRAPVIQNVCLKRVYCGLVGPGEADVAYNHLSQIEALGIRCAVRTIYLPANLVSLDDVPAQEEENVRGLVQRRDL